MGNKKEIAPGSTVVFDLDGTLVDSASDLIATLNAVIAQEGLGPIPRERVGHVVGHGALKMLDRAFLYHGLVLEDALRSRLIQNFLAIYADRLADETRPFEGVGEVLDTLKTEGWILAVCTNKYESMSRRLLAELRLDRYFAAICGSDTFAVRKPDPGHLFGTIEKAGGMPGRSIMVGDSATDIDTAKAAGIPAIGVTFGYSDVAIEELSPARTVSHFNEMMPAIRQIHETLS